MMELLLHLSINSTRRRFFKKIAEKFNAKAGDLILLMSGNANKVRTQLSALRMELGNRLGLRKGDEFAPLWVIDFHF